MDLYLKIIRFVLVVYELVDMVTLYCQNSSLQINHYSSYSNNWIDYHGVPFSIELLECGRTFSDLWGKTILHTYKN